MDFIRQTWAGIRQYPVMAWVSVIGTALSIFLIMVVVMMQQVKVAPFPPESNRDRFLHSRFLSIYQPGDGTHYSESNGANAHEYIQKHFKELKLPEAVTAYSNADMSGNLTEKGGNTVKVDLGLTDADFWKVFDFTFIEGKPYDKASFDAGLAEIVLSRSVARKLFGTTDVVGRDIDLNFATYKIVGVVEDVSTLANSAYAQVWLPYSSMGIHEEGWPDVKLCGRLNVTILAKSTDDLDAIHDEYNKRLAEVNKELQPTRWEVIPRNRPYTQEKDAVGFSSNNEPDLKGARRQRAIIFIILLLVPAINLSSMTESRLRQRVAEIGVRRAFGSTRTSIIGRIIGENLLLTLFAGFLGWLLSVIFAYFCSAFLFSQPFSTTFNPPSVNIGMLVQWSTFFWALLFCFILNLLSSGIPAWKASRTSIVNAISGHSR